MKNYWKVLTLLLALLMAIFLIGCGNGEEPAVAEEVEEAYEHEEVEEVEEPEIEEEPEVEVEPEPEEYEEIEAAYEQEEEVTGIYILIGSWVREDDESIEYTFEADGRGTRNTPGMEGGFEWVQVGDREDAVRLSSDYVSGVHGQEIWSFTMEGDVLVARKSTTNDERNSVEFRYIRVSP